MNNEGRLSASMARSERPSAIPQESSADGAGFSAKHALILNCGSSSLKFALFRMDPEPQRVMTGVTEELGSSKAKSRAENMQGELLWSASVSAADYKTAVEDAITRLEQSGQFGSIDFVGHRIVHGGPDCDCPVPLTPTIERRLRRLIPLAPLHLPANLEGVAAARARLPGAQHCASFDTAFHRSAPRLAQMTGLPPAYETDEIRRYGYHGLSYEFIVEDIARREGKAALNARIIVAHLGSGASMAAISDGRSIETTMGFSTAAGLPMATRSGDLDPGLLLYLIEEKGRSPQDARELIFHRSGLLGLSGETGDMKSLTAPNASEAAKLAVEYFCYAARKQIGALAAALGGLDRIVFTGGIGARSAIVRRRICEPLSELFALAINPARNDASAAIISTPQSRIRVDVAETDEELVIARHVARVFRPMAALGGAVS